MALALASSVERWEVKDARGGATARVRFADDAGADGRPRKAGMTKEGAGAPAQSSIAGSEALLEQAPRVAPGGVHTSIRRLESPLCCARSDEGTRVRGLADASATV